MSPRRRARSNAARQGERSEGAHVVEPLHGLLRLREAGLVVVLHHRLQTRQQGLRDVLIALRAVEQSLRLIDRALQDQRPGEVAAGLAAWASPAPPAGPADASPVCVAADPGLGAASDPTADGSVAESAPWAWTPLRGSNSSGTSSRDHPRPPMVGLPGIPTRAIRPAGERPRSKPDPGSRELALVPPLHRARTDSRDHGPRSSRTTAGPQGRPGVGSALRSVFRKPS